MFLFKKKSIKEDLHLHFAFRQNKATVNTALIAQYELFYISNHIWYRKLEFFYTVMH